VVHHLPAAAQYFDVIERIRSVEPMKDIRQDVQARAKASGTVAQPTAPEV
jgi:hypothetical protein